ncbi:hypothetical protein [Streptomyces sp. NPDC048603]
MNGHYWTRRLSAVTATLALTGAVVMIPTTAFASPTADAKASPSFVCRSR